MKKIMGLIKPFLALVLGILMLLYYLNYYIGSGVTGSYLALGIIGLVIGSWLIFAALIGLLWPRMPVGLKKVFDIVSISSFAGFMFVDFLMEVINTYQAMGASSWIIYVLGMVASSGLCAVYIISRFVRGDAMSKVASIFGLVFVLALISRLLFPASAQGPVSIDDIPLVPVLMYVIYCFLLFKSLAKEKAE